MTCKKCKPHMDTNAIGVTIAIDGVELCRKHAMVERLAAAAHHYRTMHQPNCICVHCESLKEYDSIVFGKAATREKELETTIHGKENT